MKTHFNFFTLLLCAVWMNISSLYAQVPNGSFEDWEIVGQKEVPLHWETNQTPEFQRVEKGLDAVDGNYSLKLIPAEGVSGLNARCESIAQAGFKLPTEGEPGYSLFFYVKAEALDGEEHPFLTTRVEFFQGTRRMKLDYFPIERNLPNFTLQEIKIPAFSIDSVSMQFNGSGILKEQGHGCGYRSNIWIDNIYVDVTTSTVESPSSSSPILFPNPAHGYVSIETEALENLAKYTIYDAQGTLLKSDRVSTERIELPVNGVNFILLYTTDGKIHSKKVINTAL